MNLRFEENNLSLDDYQKLRASVGWKRLSHAQRQKALSSNLMALTPYDDKAVGMGRLVGDGMASTIVDVVIMPGSSKAAVLVKGIIDRIVRHIKSTLPEGGAVSVQLIAEKTVEPFYETMGFAKIPSDDSGFWYAAYDSLTSKELSTFQTFRCIW